MNTISETFRQKPLRVHTLLKDVPLHDVWVIHLSGGGAGRTLHHLLPMLQLDDLRQTNNIVRGLFILRWQLGRWFRWDEKTHTLPSASYIHRLTEADQQKSVSEPGSKGILGQLVYQFEDEALSEIINATVHAFALVAMEAAADGYRAYLAVYVKPVNRLTPFYMALIDPFRKWFIYPAIIRKIEQSWARAYA